ncbi:MULTISPECIES: hypothetical protein [Oscillatoriales]|nr:MULTISPECIES: hypothetical protein [Oscillatoriales]
MTTSPFVRGYQQYNATERSHLYLSKSLKVVQVRSGLALARLCD